MEKLGEHFNIKKEEMIAIGDGFNDLPMIEYAGLGVAMGNAPDSIKAKANYVTLSNDEDGIAQALDKFVI
jgi:hydroxymethylpyrimidine pyrophosphatase-like HAD family hydrolase